MDLFILSDADLGFYNFKTDVFYMESKNKQLFIYVKNICKVYLRFNHLNWGVFGAGEMQEFLSIFFNRVKIHRYTIESSNNVLCTNTFATIAVRTRRYKIPAL